MKKLSLEKEEQLLRYLDGELDAQTRQTLEAEIQTSEVLSARLEELRLVQSVLVQKARLETPSKNFTMKVMSSLDTKPVTSTFTPRKGLLLFIGSIIASGIALALLSAGVFDAPTAPLVLDAPLKTDWLKVPSVSIPFNGKVLVNGILILNLALAFVVLDRTVLKPIFQRRLSSGI
jgi:anti-sigma factor RsiW